jgi:hypothetical protein
MHEPKNADAESDKQHRDRLSHRRAPKQLAIPIELYLALAICIVIEILGALVWRFFMIERGKEAAAGKWRR